MESVLLGVVREQRDEHGVLGLFVDRPREVVVQLPQEIIKIEYRRFDVGNSSTVSARTGRKMRQRTVVSVRNLFIRVDLLFCFLLVIIRDRRALSSAGVT